jgi:dihydroxy-acid dehydratase
MGDALDHWDISRTNHPTVRISSRPPAACPRQTAFSQDRRWKNWILDREKGVIRSAEHAFSQGWRAGRAVGNIAPDGCIVKTAGVDESI